MEDWEALAYEDDFESRYADELELLNELDDDDTVKPSHPIHNGPRKSLVFPTPDKPGETNTEQPGYKSSVTQGFKRRIDEMYALLSDGEESDNDLLDNFENTELSSLSSNQAKRARISTSPELNTTTERHTSSSRDIRQTVNSSVPKTVVRTCQVLTRPPIGKESISLTGSDGGRRVYLHLNKDESLESNKIDKKKCFGSRRPVNLLGVPFSVIKETIYEQKRIKLLEESKRLTNSLNSALTEEVMENDDMTEQEVPQDTGASEKSLWVDKYSPRSYMELLSDDGINRNLLSWLKLWDGVVFGKEKVKKKKEKPEQKKEKKFGYKEEDDDWMELDATGRPVNKVALLCGPPGLGKTTLAHIVAQHAGYSVIEMNASDDRSVEVFRNKIESTTQMQSVLDSGKKPNCLIIDEIDGAPTPAINVLLSAIKKKDSEPGGQQKKKKQKKQGILSRPIICICNDPYVPALRLLRQQAFVLTFPATIPGRLAQRLMEVSKKELFQTDMTTLLALCEKTENDIRSCLNTLQFLRQKRQNLTVDYIQSATIGQKDTQKTLFSLWQAIFRLPRPKKKRFALLAKPLDDPAPMLAEFNIDDPTKHPDLTSSAARFYNMLHLASSNGQYKKLENGIFENYLNMKFKDAYLNQVVSATEWLQFTDLVSQCLLQQQSFVLMRYQPFLSVAFHMFFAAPSQPKLSYPSIGYENTLKETKTQNIVSSMLSDVSPQLRGNLDLRTITVELLPLLLNIVTPTLRPVNMQLFSPSEKQQMVDLINTMISYNLTYHQERNIEGQYSYTLDPKIEDVVKFPGLPQHKQLTYATKQLIAREIDLEKMRMMEKLILRNSSKNEEPNEIENKDKKPVQSAGQSSPVVLNLKPKEIKPRKEKVP
ncbi:chromosome transmission fidelity 18 homolog, partial [Paramuricea clavata]